MRRVFRDGGWWWEDPEVPLSTLNCGNDSFVIVDGELREVDPFSGIEVIAPVSGKSAVGR